jgi:hypothetical protein
MSNPEMSKPLSISFLRMQAERCLRLSRLCMDMGTARDLRLMSEKYLAEAKQLEEAGRSHRRSDLRSDMADNSDQMQDQSFQMHRGARH